MSRIARDERGAIMVLGLFMAIFATGCLYYVMGIGDAIAQRERMQDAADAAAFSAAVLHARGMNVIALVNMTMAALLAVLIALRLIQLACIAGAAIATGLAFVTAGGSLAAVPPLTQLAIQAEQAHRQAKPAIQASLRTLRIAARAVRVVMPWAAQARTAQLVLEHYEPPARFGFEVPGRFTLPTQDGTYEDLCDKAGEHVADLVTLPLPNLPIDELSPSSLVSGLIDGGSAWFCDSEGGERPARTLRRDIHHPVLPKAQACHDYARSARPDLALHTERCAEAQREAAEADAAIHPETGACNRAAERECGLDSLYELRAARAQAACAPRAGDDGGFSKFTYQLHRYVRRYAWDDEGWTVETPIVAGSEVYRLVRTDIRPCGTERSRYGAAWNGERRRNGLIAPICTHGEAPVGPPAFGGARREVEHVEVLHVFGCVETVRERQELDGDEGELAASPEAGEKMAPQVIADGTAMGGDDLQIRAVVIGRPPSTTPAPLLSGLRSEEQRADAGRASPWHAAAQLSRFSFAQAEFYFDDGRAAPEDWLWSMRWKARLRRLRVPEREPSARSSDDLEDAARHGAGDVLGSFGEACRASAAGDDACNELDLPSFADLIAH